MKEGSVCCNKFFLNLLNHYFLDVEKFSHFFVSRRELVPEKSLEDSAKEKIPRELSPTILVPESEAAKSVPPGGAAAAA